MIESKKRKQALITLAQRDSPRERLLASGVENLSNQELLALILKTGVADFPVGEVADLILEHFTDLDELFNASLTELTAIKGIGEVKAMSLQAAMVLGQRIALSQPSKIGDASTSSSIGEMMLIEMRHLKQENLVVLMLNAKNQIIKKELVFVGTLSSSVAHPREIFKLAVKASAARIIIVHNHPSGHTEPSQNDLQFTKRIYEIGCLIGIALIDHLIIGDDSYLSFREAGFFDEFD